MNREYQPSQRIEFGWYGHIVGVVIGRCLEDDRQCLNLSVDHERQIHIHKVSLTL